MESLKVLNNRYQLLSVIKKGGFGIIYKGYDSVLGKDIVVKEIKPELLEDSKYVEQFQNEARHVAKMNHQNIVHIFDLVETGDKQFYIVMEFIKGLDLHALLKECHLQGKRLPQHLAVHIVAEVCKALDYAHNCIITENNEPCKLVHQDISPSNIMISVTGVIKLIDFGIAGVQKKSLREKNYVALQGKLPYMSPEHVSEHAVLDARSDIFSLGLILYEILEGKRFFGKEEDQKIIELLRNGKLKLKALKHTPKPLEKVLNKALEKSLEHRYQNANQFYIDLVTYQVLNNDSANIDKEVGDFVSSLTNQPALDTDDLLTLPETDILFKDILNEVGEKTTLPGLQPRSEERRPTPDQHAGDESNSPTSPTAPLEFSGMQEDEYFTQLEDEVKTIIDVVRLSTRGYKKQIQQGSLAFASLLILFFLLDLVFRWTAVGAIVYDYFFPPAIKIASVPAGATAYLNNEKLPNLTPLAIDEIEPNNYELRLSVEGYRPILKSIYVPSKGEIQIPGEVSRGGNQPFVFRFQTTLKIDSEPPDAEVYINGIQYGQNTPCSVTWEVGEPCQIELRKAGFNTLTGFRLDTENMVEEIDDHRLWRFEILDQPFIGYKIKGLFGKFFTFTSDPTGADIYLNTNPNPVGNTQSHNQIFLTAAAHKITFKKKGYNSKSLTLDVKEAQTQEFIVSLTRPVRFQAYDATNGKNQDLQAMLTKLVRNGKTVLRNKRTPAKFNLRNESYHAYFSKKGYKDVQVKISPKDKLVVAKMEPQAGQISVVVIDALSGEPLSNVEIHYKSLDEPGAEEKLLNITDHEGACTSILAPGLYLFTTSKNRYAYQEKSVMIQSSAMNLVEFNLNKH